MDRSQIMGPYQGRIFQKNAKIINNHQDQSPLKISPHLFLTYFPPEVNFFLISIIITGKNALKMTHMVNSKASYIKSDKKRPLQMYKFSKKNRKCLCVCHMNPLTQVPHSFCFKLGIQHS